MADIQQKIAAILEQRRKELGTPKTMLARKCAYGVAYLTMFLNGKRAASLSFIETLMDVLGMEIIFRPKGQFIDAEKGEVACADDDEPRPVPPMEEAIEQRVQYLYMQTEEVAYFRTGFKNGAAWAFDVMRSLIAEAVSDGRLSAEEAVDLNEKFTLETWMKKR